MNTQFATKPAAIPSANSLHALTADAMGVMTLAVMMRATLGHTGRALTADTSTLVIYARESRRRRSGCGGISSGVLSTMILYSSLIWSGAFALVAITYGRYLLTPQSHHI